MEKLARVTPATLDVLEALIGDGTPIWGLRIVGMTGRPAGSVYPILERLERLGWIESEWEDEPTRSGPRRRLYRLSLEGAEAARTTVASRTSAPVQPRAGWAGA